MAKDEGKRSAQAEPVVVADQDTALYHVGTLEGCAFQNVTAGGICFPLFTEKVKFDEQTQQTERSRRTGDILPLTEADVRRVKEAISKKVIRWVGGRVRGFILSMDKKGFRQMPGDEPLGKYLYMDRLSEEALSQEGYGKPLE